MADFIRKQVVFNPADPDQEQLMQHAASRTNFSAYVKRLIQRDMEGGQSAVPAQVPIMEQPADFELEGFI